jgi:hypothetical protein
MLSSQVKNKTYFMCFLGTWTKDLGTKRGRTKCIGPKHIGDKTYWRQNVSATKCIGHKTYGWTKRIDDKTYCWTMYRRQNISADLKKSNI